MKYLSEMIDVRELRVGNLVMLMSKEPIIIPLKPVIVASVNWLSLEVYTEIEIPKYRQNPIYVSAKEIGPIPLSEEWLVKFGFEIKTWFEERTTGAEHQRILNGKIARFDIVFTSGEWWHDYVYGKCFGYTEIKYVHQLQNLFYALTGEELTIK